MTTKIVAFVSFFTLSSVNKLSPNGKIPLLTKSFIDFVDLTKFMAMTPQEQQAETMKYLAIASPIRDFELRLKNVSEAVANGDL